MGDVRSEKNPSLLLWIWLKTRPCGVKKKKEEEYEGVNQTAVKAANNSSLTIFGQDWMARALLPSAAA